MEIDPRLERLQALIEQKRAQQDGTRNASPVGRSGNPRFAEAAQRVKEAMSTRSINGNDLSLERSASKVTSIMSRLSEASSVNPSQSVNAGQLTGPLEGSNVYMGENAPTKKVGPRHLGKNLDLYA